MQTALRLTIGQKYKVLELVALPVCEWIDPINTLVGLESGYNYLDWFRDGVYLGPDCDGVEPLFEVGSVGVVS